MSLRGVPKVVVSIVSALALGCRSTPSVATSVKGDLSVEVSGCASVVATSDGKGTACALAEDRKVRVLVALGEGSLSAHAGASVVPLGEPRSNAMGVLYTLSIPLEVSAVVLRREAPGTASEATVRFAPSPRPTWFADANTKRQKGDLDGALALATPGLASSSDTERAAALGLVARIALRRGNIDDAADGLAKAIALDERAGLVSDRADDAFALVYLLHQRAPRYAEARRVLAEVEPKLASYPDGRARFPLYRAQLAWQTGDTRAAMRDLDDAIVRSERLGASSIARSARQVKSMVACSAGSIRTCVAGLREADAVASRTTDVPACERAELAVSLGFAELEAAEASGQVHEALGRSDARALEILDKSCPDRYLRALAHQHLAVVACLRRDTTTAKRELAAARADAKEPRAGDAVTWLAIEARIAELEGKSNDAIARFDASRALARASALRTKEVHALVGKARVLAAKGTVDLALATLQESEALVDAIVATVPFGEGRASAAADGTEGVRLGAELLLREGNAALARSLLRHARGRLLASLAVSARVAALEPKERADWDARVAEYRAARSAVDADAVGDWKLSRAALEAVLVDRREKLSRLGARLEEARALLGSLPSQHQEHLRDREIPLFYARVGELREITGFVASPSSTRAFRVPEVTKGTSPESLGEAMLAPAWTEITSATQVRIETDASLVGIDVHAAVVHGEPLALRVPVVYGAGLTALSPEASGRSRVLVVSDPTGDLPSSRAEGVDVATLLGPDVRRLTGREATASEARAALVEARLFHYAGHGAFRGVEGESSFLPLAQGGALTFADVLALASPGAPRYVVLSGCEAGREEGTSEEAVAGLAQAFLVAGADVVVAPATVVDDTAAASLAHALYTDADAGAVGDLDLPRRLHLARLAAQRAGKPWWKAFRAFAR